MTMFQRAMEMFYPQSGVRGGGAVPAERDHPGAADDRDLEGLRREINALKQQLDTLAKKSD